MSAVEPDRTELAPLFAGHDRLRVVIDTVLEGVAGTATSAGGAAARLDLGVYRFFGGDPEAAGTSALLDPDGLPAPSEIVVDGTAAWTTRIERALPGRLRRREMEAFAQSDAAEPDLAALVDASPAPVRPLDGHLAAELDAALPPNSTASWGGPGPFAERGLGFVAVESNRAVAAATSYALSASGCEIAIGTRPGFRRRGLARAVAARLILECRARRLEPHWNAANPTSSRLARALGMRPIGVAAVFDLLPQDRSGRSSCRDVPRPRR